MLQQALYLIKKFGFFRLARMKRHHDKSLPVIRGYITCSCLWALLNEGFLDAASSGEGVSLTQYARERKLNLEILKYVCEYLDVLKLLRLEGDRCFLEPRCRVFLKEPRGTFDLLFGYEPVFHDLGGLLTNRKQYGKDVFRRGEFVARGSGELGLQLPFPMMIGFAKEYGVRKVLDLGSGDLEFLFALCREIPQISCVGIDNSKEAVDYARQRLQKSEFASRVGVFHCDMFDFGRIKELAPDVDGITAVDVFHEYLKEGTEKVEQFLSRLRKEFKGVPVIVGEFCRQPHEKLKKNPTGFLEHDLFHNLSGQVIIGAQDWITLFGAAGYKIVDKRVIDLVGHGYFVLQ